tara:strand:- start:837 stop:1553 length:717 start_codon:yes stop_codon:yes gene_type:complete
MSKKFIVLDTETTGLEVEQGHRVIEIGAVLVEDRKKTNESFHVYLNPERPIDDEAQKVHGISNEQLKDEPKFFEIADEFLKFIENATLIIHNAPFDLGFLNNELKLASEDNPSLEDKCEVIDSLLLAREKYPGQRNSLDALSKRFDVTGYDRTFHGALLDANILADVYFNLTGGQKNMDFTANNQSAEHLNDPNQETSQEKIEEIVEFKLSGEDLNNHDRRISEIESMHSIKSIWNSK